MDDPQLERRVVRADETCAAQEGPRFPPDRREISCIGHSLGSDAVQPSEGESAGRRPNETLEATLDSPVDDANDAHGAGAGRAPVGRFEIHGSEHAKVQTEC